MTACFLTALLVSVPAFSQTAASSGYVVKADSGAVYLDLGQNAGAAPGQAFLIYKEGEELKHPVTGLSLGRTEVTVAEGTVTEVQPLFSIGTVTSRLADIAPGQRARLGAAVPRPAPATAPAAITGDGPQRAPNWRSAAFDYQAVGMAVADFDGDGKPDTVLADERTVYLYPYPALEDKPLARHSLTGTGQRFLSLEAGDLDGDGRAELFGTLHDPTFNRVETIVLARDAEKGWKLTARLPWIVRAYQDETGKKILAAQRLIDDASFPFGTIYPLLHQGGKYVMGRPAVRPDKRVQWIYDFTFASLDGGKAATLFLTSTELLRVQFEKNYWKTSESYGQTPIRLRWSGRLLNFRPPMLAHRDEKGGGLYIFKNIGALGGLAQPFGLFTSGMVQRLDWNGVSLNKAWQAELGGYGAGMALTASAPGKTPELSIAVVGTAGKSVIWAYDP